MEETPFPFHGKGYKSFYGKKKSPRGKEADWPSGVGAPAWWAAISHVSRQKSRRKEGKKLGRKGGKARENSSTGGKGKSLVLVLGVLNIESGLALGRREV